MKNTIKETRNAELQIKAAADKEKAKKERLDKIAPRNIVATMSEVTNKVARAVRNEEGDAYGVNGGKYLQEMYKNIVISGKTPEDLEIAKKRIDDNISGDGLLHKVVYINGHRCECVGKTEAELEADIAAAEDYMQAHIDGSIYDIDIAEQLVDAEYKQEDLEEIINNEDRYLLCISGKYIMDTEGNTLVDLSDINSELSKDDAKTILLERLTAYLQ